MASAGPCEMQKAFAAPKRPLANVAFGSIFRICDRSWRSDRGSALRVEAIIGASAVAIALGTSLWQHGEADLVLAESAKSRHSDVLLNSAESRRLEAQRADVT